MPVPDTTITQWFPDYRTLNNNTPKPTDKFLQLFDDELRNIKSVVRAITLDKAYQNWGFPFTVFSATSLHVTGDQTGVLLPGRRVRIIRSSGSPADERGWIRTRSTTGSAGRRTSRC